MYKFLIVFSCALVGLHAQVRDQRALQPNPTQQPVADTGQAMPIFRVTVVSRTAKAINYRHRSGATKIDFRGTALMPQSRGEAKVESKQGYIEIEVEFDDINAPASKFGPEYLTYVMWAISPEGRASNLGEVILNGNRSKLNITTELQSFGLIVTAEPYFAVTQPSDVVVMENIVRADTKGKVEEIDAKYELLKRGQYTMAVEPSERYSPVRVESKSPLELQQARNAVEIARLAGADDYAADSYKKAEKMLAQAEDYFVRKQKKPTVMIAREAVQTAEDARAITIQRIEEERLAKERAAAAQREADARAATARAEAEQRAEAERRQRAESDRALSEQARLAAEQARSAAEKAQADAERMKREAERAAAFAGQQKAEAEAASAAALAQQQAAQADAERARAMAEQANRQRAQAEQEKAEMRQRLLQQLNMILETRDSARGLIVSISDVLFDTARYTLKPAAREKLAKVAGIVLAYPGLRLQVEGHTDSVGSDDYNQKLSEQRSGSVQDYLVQQGIPAASVTAVGFGEAQPVASNDTSAGRQQNRRVEMVVSGDVIGVELGSGMLSNTAPATEPLPRTPQQ